MEWNSEYKELGTIWGDKPSELAMAAVVFLKNNRLDGSGLNIIDIGCGYGRDALYLLNQLRCRVLGIDISEEAIALATETIPVHRRDSVEFRVLDFKDLGDGRFNAVYLSNLYQLLDREARSDLRSVLERLLEPGGLLFLSTLSISDLQHYGKGTPVPDEPNSFIDGKYLHLCTRDELLADFDFMEVKELYEREYDEPRANGEAHHHISWILMGKVKEPQ